MRRLMIWLALAVAALGTAAAADPDDRVLQVNAFPPAGASGVAEWVAGSATVIDREAGHVVTATSLLTAADKIELIGSDGRRRPAAVIGRDPAGIALLKVDPALLSAAAWQDGVPAAAQAKATALGYSPAADWNAVAGTVKNLDYNSAVAAYELTPGLSRTMAGGALVGEDGRLLGILLPATENNRPPLAAAIADVRAIMRLLLTQPVLRTGVYGLTLGENDGNGIKLTKATPGGAAEKAGLRDGDLLLTLDGQPIPSVWQTLRRLRANPVGTEIALGYRRDGKDATVRIRSVAGR